MKKYIHLILFIVTILFTALCAWLMPQVNVNSDMTKYLPNKSPMKTGLEIVTSEFDASQLQTADIKAMFKGLNDVERKEIATKLAFYKDIKDVTYVVSADSVYTLFKMVAPQSVDQKALGKVIRADFPKKDVIVETGQDGATPPFSVILVAVGVVIAILLLMSSSWLDPILLLISMGMAIVINIGTNSFLPSVSITTNYIGSILQMVLSLDYSVVLMNRYRQEMSDNCTPTESVNRALKGSFIAILNSALTTIVGMMMLAFMRLKIGLDMGVVLAKGVVCSLLCTFTFLPWLLICCNKLLKLTSKRVFVVPTDRLGRFATNHKIPLTIFAIVLFGVSFYWSRKTDIYFSTNGESQIAKVFPETNPFLLIYDTSEEMAMLPIAEELSKDSCVKGIISYPTLLKQRYTAEELSSYIGQLAIDMADYMPPIDEGPMELLTPEVMRLVYYLRTQNADTLKVGFTDLMSFIKEDCLNNPMFADIIDSNIRQQMALLDVMLNQPAYLDDEDEDEEEPIVVKQPQPVAVVETPAPVTPVSAPVIEETIITQDVTEVEQVASDNVPVIDFIAKLNVLYQTEDTYQLTRLTDTTLLRQEMNARQMSGFIGSTVSQTKMVYSFSDQGKYMTPIAYVNFLSNDLFNRKSLENMVSSSQKVELRSRAKLMNYADKNLSMSASEMSELLSAIGIYITDERVKTIANPRLAATDVKPIKKDETPKVVTPQQQPEQQVASTSVPVETVSTVSAAKSAEAERQAKIRAREKAKAARQAALMDELMYSKKKYTADAMTNNFTTLGEQINPIFVNLLYNYYGSKKCYDESLQMSLEEMLTYVADTLVNDNRFDNFLDDRSREIVLSTRNQLAGSVGMLSNDKHSLFVIQTDLDDESAQTYAFVDHLHEVASSHLQKDHYFVGQSVMFSEMKNGFNHEMAIVTILTALAIFLIVAISFRSLIVPTILVLTVMTAMYVNVIYSGVTAGEILYLAYLIVQSILMGATIDYGILYTNYYKEYRKTMEKYESARMAYHGAIGTIMTSGLILVLGPGVMAILVDDVTIGAIVGSISIGALAAILLILLVLPGVLVACDKLVVSGIFGLKKTK